MSISRLQQPLGVAPDEASFINMHNLSPLLIVVILFGIVVLATMSIRLRRARVSTERPVEVESSERKSNMVEPLSCVRRAMENVSKILPEIRQKKTAATAPQANLMSLGSPTKASCTDNSEEKIAKVTARLRELVERSQRLLAAMQTFDRNNSAPLLKLENADSSVQARNYLSFFLGNELFAISTRNVKEVVDANKLIIEPNRPWRTRRAINLRGSVVPVIDLSTYFGGEPTKVNQSTHIVILVLNHGKHLQMIGVMVDVICKILEFSPSSIKRPTARQTDIRSALTMGTIELYNCSITLLDISRGLSMGIFPKSNSAPRVLE
ncbi:chemotaxis protein CheW [Pseudomonas lini]